MPTPPHRHDLREVRIALNADPGLGRAAACRLALAGDGWLRGAPAPTARALGLPGSQLERARRVAAVSGRLARRELRRAERAGARLVTFDDPGYPRPLADLALPPPVLYAVGELPAALVATGRGVAVVGSRRASAYGREAAGQFGRALAAAGWTVVSGCAPGVDAAAHRGALAAGGPTVAVLGCGIDVDYPAGHGPLRREIAGAGAVVTEFPCGAAPRRWHFPVRNRILAALGRATLVVQATERSGSLITARLALELGRDVLAVPGPIFDRRSRGPNRLIADGAAPAGEPRDVLDALVGPSAAWLLCGDGAGPSPDEATVPRLPGLKGRVLAALPLGGERTPGEVAAAVGREVDAVLAALLELEIEGWARRRPGPTYGRTALDR